MSAAQTWITAGKFDREITTLYSDSIFNKLYAGGWFMSTDGMLTRGVAQWNGLQWDSLQSGVEDYNQVSHQKIWRFIRFKNNINLLGAFDKVGHVFSKSIAKWNGISWDSLTPVPNDAIFNAYVVNGNLFITGAFDSIGALLANGLAAFDDTSWFSVHAIPKFDIDGVSNNLITAVVEYQNTLFVGGNFYGDSGLVDISYWNGQQWKDVAGGLKGNLSEITCMTIFQNKLYVAGYFRMSDGNAGNSIMYWDGNTWNDVGGGVGGFAYSSIRDMKVIDGDLYVVGYFLTAGGITANNIAKWDGIKWCGFRSNFDNVINSIVQYNDSIFIGGAFQVIENDSVSFIAKLNAASYSDTCSAIGISEIDFKNGFTIYPNPAQSLITIYCPVQPNKIYIQDITGRTLECNSFSARDLTIDISDMNGGIYFLKAITVDGPITRKFVKE